ncbi:hypothetical protein DPMN_133866 [Dreissena polymorpha]|uniref:Uncharacterized protein n=1 Tax=Dreissena polymorpha TaxID=45954 RepID=A0A9D4G0Y4_DREPO|nr:hypothetical protein DPMN_133866 [Dreissena polymorpha]
MRDKSLELKRSDPTEPVPTGIHAIIDRFLAEHQAVWSAGPRRPVTLPGPGPWGKCSTSPTRRMEPH